MFGIGLTKTTLSNIKKEGVEVLSLETYQVVISLRGVIKMSVEILYVAVKTNSKQKTKSKRGMRYLFRVETVSRKWGMQLQFEMQGIGSGKDSNGRREGKDSKSLLGGGLWLLPYAFCLFDAVYVNVC